MATVREGPRVSAFGECFSIRQVSPAQGVAEAGGTQKLQTDRVILVPGAQEEINVVQSIYRRFVKEGKSEAAIADELNANGVASGCDRPWSRGMVHQILVNEKYIGNNVYNRISFKLKKKRVCNPPEMWVRADGAFDAIVDSELFFTARRIIQDYGIYDPYVPFLGADRIPPNVPYHFMDDAVNGNYGGPAITGGYSPLNYNPLYDGISSSMDLSFALYTVPVPEPVTFGLLGIGGLALMCRRPSRK